MATPWQVRWLHSCDVPNAHFVSTATLNKLPSDLGLLAVKEMAGKNSNSSRYLSTDLDIASRIASSKAKDRQYQEQIRSLNTKMGKSHLHGYFGESYIHHSVLNSLPSSFQADRVVAMDGVHMKDGSFRSIRDLVSQLWFDDWDEVTCGAIGLCDLTVPSNPHAVVNRERIGSTPTAIEGLERMLRSGVVNAAFHACEALSQLAFRNSRNGARIMRCANPNMMRSLDDLLTLDDPALDEDSLFELKTAVLRVFSNCAWNSGRICDQISGDVSIVTHVEVILKGAKHICEGHEAALTTLDAGIGLLNHLSSHTHGRDTLVSRNTAQLILLPIVLEAEARATAPDLYLCAVAGAVEVMIKLLWDTSSDPPFVPHRSVLQTIVWTLVCSLDGITWAGITWSSLGRVQALSQLSAADAVKATLIELSLVETLSRVLHQWTKEQGVLVLEHALLTLLNLMALDEARWRMYRSGIHGTLRVLIADPNEISATARERAVLCAWLLYEWQVGKLEVLDRRTAQLIQALEESERARLGLEMECARLRSDWEGAVEAIEAGQRTLLVTCEGLASELHGTRQALLVAQAQRRMESAAAQSFVAHAGEAAKKAKTLVQSMQQWYVGKAVAEQMEQHTGSIQQLQKELQMLALACDIEIQRNTDLQGLHPAQLFQSHKMKFMQSPGKADSQDLLASISGRVHSEHVAVPSNSLAGSSFCHEDSSLSFDSDTKLTRCSSDAKYSKDLWTNLLDRQSGLQVPPEDRICRQQLVLNAPERWEETPNVALNENSDICRTDWNSERSNTGPTCHTPKIDIYAEQITAEMPLSTMPLPIVMRSTEQLQAEISSNSGVEKDKATKVDIMSESGTKLITVIRTDAEDNSPVPSSHSSTASHSAGCRMQMMH